jgi:hypothetical protein
MDVRFYVCANTHIGEQTGMVIIHWYTFFCMSSFVCLHVELRVVINEKQAHARYLIHKALQPAYTSEMDVHVQHVHVHVHVHVQAQIIYVESYTRQNIK